MAKGEGGEQYSNASLLNKQPSSDDIKLAKKVIHSSLFFKDAKAALWGWFFDGREARKAGFLLICGRALRAWMNGGQQPGRHGFTFNRFV